MSAAAPMEPIFDNVPQELRVLPRWMTWKLDSARGKIPYVAGRSNDRASSTDPTTWRTFEEAEAAYFECNLFDQERHGIGIALNGDGIVGVDIDNCFTDGQPSEAAMNLLNDLGAQYIEKSPSGLGLRAFGYGEQLEAGVNAMHDGLKAEFYSDRRYLTVTGHAIKKGPVAPFKNFKATAERFRGTKKSKADSTTGDSAYMPQDERHAALIAAILSGDVYHDSLRDLAASMVAAGMKPGAVVNHLRALMDRSSGPHDQRWADRKAQIPGLVQSATEKFGPASDQDFEDLMKAASAEYESAPGDASSKTPNDPSDDAASADTPSPHKPAPYKLLTSSDLEALPPQEWIVHGVLPRRGVGAVVGASTAGKTFFALSLGAHISLGWAFDGIPTTAAPVVYVGLEGQHGLQQRVKAWQQHHQVTLPDTFRFVLQPFHMLQPEKRASLAAAVLHAGGKGGVIIIDTLSRATPGADENSSVDMGKIIAAATQLEKATGGLVLLAHHKGKNDAAGARGHSSLYGALDAAVAVSNTAGGQRNWSTDPAKGGKSKDGEPVTKLFSLKSVQVGTDSAGLPITSAVAVPDQASMKTGKALTPTQKTAMEAFRNAAMVFGELDAEGEFAGLHVDHWSKEFYKITTVDSTHAKKVAFQRVRNELKALNRIFVTDNVYRLAGEESFLESSFAEALRQKGGR